MPQNAIHVTSEIGTLERLIIHSPDGGIGKVVPSKFQEWLYDDTVYLDNMRREYNEYIKVLLYFLDPEKIEYIRGFERNHDGQKQMDCFIPGSPHYFNSDKVLDTQHLLAKVLEQDEVRTKIISAVCAWEGCSFSTEKKLHAVEDTHELAKVLISGVMPVAGKKHGQFVFQPLPNFIFTRDIGITLHNHLLLSNAATAARERESLLMKFISYYHLFKNNQDGIIEISESSQFFLLNEEEQRNFKTSVEGGDVMMISKGHLLIGISERTTASAVNEIIHAIFKNSAVGIDKITVIKIPRHRAQMHIDTVFTQVSCNTWVLFGKFSELLNKVKNENRYSYYHDLDDSDAKQTFELVEVFRYQKALTEAYDAGRNYQVDISAKVTGLESLLRNISQEDFGIPGDEVKIIYSGNNVFPYDEREQWTDSCNLLALKDGVVVGYDRNPETLKGFAANGYNILKAAELFDLFDRKALMPETIKDTLILLPSGELSRARGGAHCMSMPLLRKDF
ncbi:arginine deiminase family protein [Foetidibacter luteolus]|uniref:arginine deiminase family protein n=1 Tax=Foetidibacter luteolus TaxID=2608880 RepID=UPI00129BFBBF|nr:arginine deiminase family protein [Foetidibacter luteolus]